MDDDRTDSAEVDFCSKITIIYQMMSMEMICRQVQKETLDTKQTLGLKQLILLSQTMRSPDDFESTKGIKGMEVAHEILSSRNAVGILIGGLAGSLWKQTKKLASHKDVDVMVATESFNLKENFEGGIDWWLPTIDRLRVNYATGIGENIPCKWWENGNGVVLFFGIEQVAENLEGGLYLPTRKWFEDMRLTEALSRVDPTVEGVIDEEVIDRFREKVSGHLGHRIHEDVPVGFRNRISTEDQIAVAGTELPIIRAIKAKKKGM